MTEKLTPSAMRAALMKDGKAKTAKAREVVNSGGDVSMTKPDPAAMWAKAFRRPDTRAAPGDIAVPIPVASGNPPRAAHNADNVDRNALWAKAIKEAQSLPPLHLEPD
ncbi:hypothetical protein ACCC98_06740 [Rhizobium pisi]|uniref:hypothetical protein n=1 Tax=Rhizobium pisi TaxID=574561 RepID=UPI0039B03686